MNNNIKIPHCYKCLNNDQAMCSIDMSIIKNNIFWCPFYLEDTRIDYRENRMVVKCHT